MPLNIGGTPSFEGALKHLESVLSLDQVDLRVVHAALSDFICELEKNSPENLKNIGNKELSSLAGRVNCALSKMEKVENIFRESMLESKSTLSGDLERVSSILASRAEQMRQKWMSDFEGFQDFDAAIQTASWVPQGESREVLLEFIVTEAVRTENYIKAQEALNMMTQGEKKECLLGTIVMEALRVKNYREALQAVKWMEPGEKKERIGSVIRELKNENYLEAAKFAKNIGSELLECIMLMALRKKKYSESLEVLKEGGFSNEEVPLFLFEYVNKNKSKWTMKDKEDVGNVVFNFFTEKRSFSFFKRTLYPPFLVEKGLGIPLSIQSIPKPDQNTPLDDLNHLNILSDSENKELSFLKIHLKLKDVELEKWILLYEVPERQRLESFLTDDGQHVEFFTEAQKARLRRLDSEGLSKFWTLQGKKIIEEGCKDLYVRIQNQDPLWSAGDSATVNERTQVIYDRMTALVTHLVHRAKTVPEDKESILFLLARAAGRCEGVLTEFETLYRQYCLQESDLNSIDAALEYKGYFIRQGMIDLYVNEHESLSDVHKLTVFKNLIASETGTVPLLEGEAEKVPIYRKEAQLLASSFLREFPDRYLEEFSKTLLELLLDTQSQEKVKIDGSFELFSEMILQDMESLGCFEDFSEALQVKKEQVLAALREGIECSELPGFPVEDVISAIEESAPDKMEKIIQNKVLFEPLYREKLSKEVVEDYLVKKGFFQDLF